MSQVNVAQYAISFLISKGITTTFMVTGGMAMHLNQALAEEPRMEKVCCHHEQGCSLAAEGYAHVTAKPALVQVTAGPGAINAMTGVFGAYVDGLPMIVISGQPKTETLCSTYGLTGSLRQAGEQEADVIGMAKSITKYAVRVTKPERIAYELEKAYYLATSGRPAPVWLEIPLDVQASMIDEESLQHFHVVQTPKPDLRHIAHAMRETIAKAKRPMLVVGAGVRQSHAVEQFCALAEALSCPVLCAGTLDIIQKEHPLYAGGMGNVGTRAGNINVQNADVLIFIGVTMHLTFTTYNWHAMGKNAHKIVVENEAAECERPQYIADTTYLCPTEDFIDALYQEVQQNPYTVPQAWRDHCTMCVNELSAVPEGLRTVTEDGRINPYYFAEELFTYLPQKSIVVPGNAFAGVTAQQAGALQKGQRLIANFGNGPMGMGVPAAIGAAFAGEKACPIVCLDGDGSFMMNMQELATIKEHALPITIFIYNNGGYASIRLSQQNMNYDALGWGNSNGLSFPDYVALAKAFGIDAMRLQGKDFASKLPEILQSTAPQVVEVMLDTKQGFEPKIAAKRLPDGRMVSSPPEDMFPFMDAEVLQKYLINP